MKKFKRVIAFALFLCMTISLLPPVQLASAAVSQRYELDTDGIDVGATYLIVNTGTAGSANALMFKSNSSFQKQALTVKSGDGVTYIDTGFTNEDECQFQFTGTSSGRVTHDSNYVDLRNSKFVTSTSTYTNLTFSNQGSGQYRIYYNNYFRSYYLRYSSNKWSGSNTTASVFLFKLTEYVSGYDVTYEGNGNTSGTLPDNEQKIAAGTEYTVRAPQNLRKDVGEDTWLFQSWNTAADGSGTEYLSGDTIIMSENVTLYAQWYQQTKHTVSMITYLDGVPTDVDKFAGYDRQFYAVLEGGDGSYITLTRRAEGTYSAKVTENGTYTIYAITADGKYEQVHGHTVVIYGQDGTTECMHYSITYDANGGTWAAGEEPAAGKCHYGEPVTAYDKIPTRDGYNFLGWRDQDNNLYAPEQLITQSADKKLVLTADWEKQMTVTVNVTINHKAQSGGSNNDQQTMHEVLLNLLRYDEENKVNLPVAERLLNSEENYDKETDTTTYQVVFDKMPRGLYRAASVKSNYETAITYTTVDEDHQVIDIDLVYKPGNFDLAFEVQVNGLEELMPKAVNVKVTYWGFDENNVLGWHTITQQEGNNAPTTVTIENGKGTGYYPVWKYWTDGINAYDYRVEVVSFILPDNTIVPASGDGEDYTSSGSGLYSATVTVEGDNRVPTYPNGSTTTLPGAYFDGEKQVGVPTVTVQVDPMTVTFIAGEGTVNGQQTIVLENQYRYPALHEYVAVPKDTEKLFVGWADEQGNLLTDMSGQLLPGNVTYVARYSENLTIFGKVTADATYQQDGQTVQIHDIDRVESVWVVLQKKVGDVYNDVTSTTAELTYEKDENGRYTVGVGEYKFENLPNDGTEYRVHLLVLNYAAAYDNDQNESYSQEEAVAVLKQNGIEAEVDIFLDFAVESYLQEFRVDASQIHPDLRPTGALAQILYRDLGDSKHYQVISQHTVEPYGVMMDLNNSSATDMGAYSVWNQHTNGTPYEYQLQISTVYGNDVEGAYSKEGTPYTADRPYTIVYGPSNNYLQQITENGVVLEAMLVPKQYRVELDLNLGDDPGTPVLGLEEYMADDGTGHDRYLFVHTWSYAEQFTAYPYREGYVFDYWENLETGEKFTGLVSIGNALAKNITLTAHWTPLSGTDYTIRYLELNTDKVLHSATMANGAALGSQVYAAKQVLDLEGYVYAGAMVDGVYMDKTQNPVMTVTNDPVKNLMVIYYLPDGSDGFTEQVESNIEANKTAVLEDNGTYTITIDTFTKDNPITTWVKQDTPLDIVLVLDQSGSMYTGNALDDLKSASESFINLIAEHGRENQVDHRVAVVGYASDQYSGYTNYYYPTAGGDGTMWVNTGVFDSNGDFHIYPVTGFNYTEYTGQMVTNGTYYTYADGEYLLLTYHENYRHLITAEEARIESLNGTPVYGYVDGQFVELTRNSSGLWLYGDKLLYSDDDFFTYHTDVWTHRHGLERREIHAYGTGADYHVVGKHQGVYTRTETREANPQKNIYSDALVPVTVGANGSGAVTPGLLKATQNIGANGETFVSYGIEMANSIFAANPVDPTEGRVRIMVVFTDGKPGDSSNFDEVESNKALAQSYIATHDYKATVYTIGLYGDNVVAAESDQDYFMNGLSSNYPDAKEMDDVWLGVNYQPATSGYRLDNGGPYFVEISGKFYTLERKSVYQNKVYYIHWGYTNESGTFVPIYQGLVADGHPVITNSKVGDYTIYRRYGDGYQETPYSGYYTVAHNNNELQQYFANAVQSITTNITTEIILHEDTILRDIMGEGLVLTPGTVITAYKEKGEIKDGQITWSGELEYVASATVPESMPKKVTSAETTDIRYTLQDNTVVVKENVPYIQVYNLDSKNPLDPDKEDYHPHTVDITGYDFENWYISESKPEGPEGYKMVVTITRIEARDEVQWGRSTSTNNNQSGVWLPADQNGNRQLLLPFDQPSTIFVERAYVLDYGKEFTLSGWYFEDEYDEDGKLLQQAEAVHVDCNIEDGMNWFGTANTSNAVNGAYGNTNYGNVQVTDGDVTYTPTTMNWGGYDQFYVFGNTWRRTVKAQDANENGNLWNKVTVIPANNIYYEDSFVTKDAEGEGNAFSGLTFNGDWTVKTSGDKHDTNVETPEHMESAPYGDVHGWTDSLGNDFAFTDGSAHKAYNDGYDPKAGARVEFTFTGTGVDVYTYTNATSGMVVAMLNRVTKDSSGKETSTLYKSIAIDNLAKSGDYYHIPTVSFDNLPYGTYSLLLMATATTDASTGLRYEYYIDGVRIYNPLGNTTNYQSDVVKYAYDLETNAVFTEVRDVLLNYSDFDLDADLPEEAYGKLGAVFIDWIKDGQGTGDDKVGTGVPTYEIGTFEAYGPKNEVYLSEGQAVVLKVDEGNNYYVGLKNLKGVKNAENLGAEEVTVNVSGIDMDEPTTIKLSHTTDMYYQVTPVNGYIVIQNASDNGAILSITNLRTTNLTAPVADGGILPITQEEAVEIMDNFSAYLLRKLEEERNAQPDGSKEEIPSAQEQAQATQQQANKLFTAVRQWLETN